MFRVLRTTNNLITYPKIKSTTLIERQLSNMKVVASLIAFEFIIRVASLDLIPREGVLFDSFVEFRNIPPALCKFMCRSTNENCEAMKSDNDYCLIGKINAQNGKHDSDYVSIKAVENYVPSKIR